MEASRVGLVAVAGRLTKNAGASARGSDIPVNYHRAGPTACTCRVALGRLSFVDGYPTAESGNR
jgi:hypothetical protein